MSSDLLGLFEALLSEQFKLCFDSLLVLVVLRFTVVDNSDFSPNRLTVSINSSYPSL